MYHELLDESVYLASISTMYRILRAHGEVRERRRQASHPARVKPELVATAPNQVYSWDICPLSTPRRDVIRSARADVLAAAYTRNPERFARKHPEPAALRPAAWINKPPDQDQAPNTQ